MGFYVRKMEGREHKYNAMASCTKGSDRIVGRDRHLLVVRMIIFDNNDRHIGVALCAFVSVL